jgi:MerR family transcriptional regulator, copper efflux regulator
MEFMWVQPTRYRLTALATNITLRNVMIENSSELLRIGNLCELSGATARTVRHYEAEGLVAAHATTLGGQKYYPAAAADTIAAVQVLQELGLSIRQIRALFATAASEHVNGKELSEELRRTVADIGAGLATRIKQLQAAHKAVAAVAADTACCDGCPGSDCARCGKLAQLRTLGLTKGA